MPIPQPSNYYLVGFVHPKAKEKSKYYFKGPYIEEDEVYDVMDEFIGKPVCLNHKIESKIGVVDKYHINQHGDIFIILKLFNSNLANETKQMIENGTYSGLSLGSEYSYEDDHDELRIGKLTPIEISVVKKGAIDRSYIFMYGTEKKLNLNMSSWDKIFTKYKKEKKHKISKNMTDSTDDEQDVLMRELQDLDPVDPKFKEKKERLVGELKRLQNENSDLKTTTSEIATRDLMKMINLSSDPESTRAQFVSELKNGGRFDSTLLKVVALGASIASNFEDIAKKHETTLKKLKAMENKNKTEQETETSKKRVKVDASSKQSTSLLVNPPTGKSQQAYIKNKGIVEMLAKAPLRDKQQQTNESDDDDDDDN